MQRLSAKYLARGNSTCDRISTQKIESDCTTKRFVATPDTDASLSFQVNIKRRSRSCNSSTRDAMSKNSAESWQPRSQHRDSVKAQGHTLSFTPGIVRKRNLECTCVCFRHSFSFLTRFCGFSEHSNFERVVFFQLDVPRDEMCMCVCFFSVCVCLRVFT